MIVSIFLCCCLLHWNIPIHRHVTGTFDHGRVHRHGVRVVSGSGSGSPNSCSGSGSGSPNTLLEDVNAGVGIFIPMIRSCILRNKKPCKGLVKKSAIISSVGQLLEQQIVRTQMLLRHYMLNRRSRLWGKVPKAQRLVSQGPMVNQAEAYYPQAKRSYADVVRNNRSTHSIELIK